MRKTVFITGASRGIGKAIGERFEREGYLIVAPGRAELDLSSVDSVKAYLSRNSGLQADVLINNAGENKVNSIDRISLDDWQRILTTNLTSAFLLTQAAAPHMVARKWGRVINISSIFSLLGRPGRAAYSASKSGLNGLTRAAALEYGPSNILVNAVCPGYVETDMTRQNNSAETLRALSAQTALGRLAAPEEIASLVFHLGSEQNTYLTGQTVVIDGGFSCQ
jgi:3-oxoacyl-[acyl-carrier protein] reductase